MFSDDPSPVRHPGFTPQLFAVLAATLNAISDGMNYAWSSPTIPRLKQPGSPIKITDNDETWLEITLLVAGLVGLPLTTYLVDKIGRKQSTLAAACTGVIGWFLIGIANNVIYLYVGRFIMGVAADISFISSPMYISEISHKSIRGFFSGIIYVMSFSGILIMYVIGPYVEFWVPSIVAIVILTIQICSFPFMPDSPYFLLVNDKREEAEASLKKLRGREDVEEEIEEIQEGIEREAFEEKGKVMDLITVPSIRRAVIIMTILNAGQHMGGYTVITMNLHSILSEAKSEYLEEEPTAVLFATLMLISSVLAILLVDNCGRRIILILSTLTTGITLTTIGIYFYLQDDQNVSSISWIPTVAVMFFAVTFKLGLGMVPIVLTAELFPTSVKAYGMASADAMYVIFGSISIYAYQFLRDYGGGMYMPFFLFAGCCFLTGLFVILFLPETKGKSLEEIQYLLKE